MYKTYQYKIVVALSISEKELNEYGQEGWDNYAVEGNRFYFKRDGKPKEIKISTVASTNGTYNNNRNAVKSSK